MQWRREFEGEETTEKREVCPLRAIKELQNTNHYILNQMCKLACVWVLKNLHSMNKLCLIVLEKSYFISC